MSQGDIRHLFGIMMMLVCLKISTSSGVDSTDNEMANAEVYKAFLTNVLNRSKPVQRTKESDNKMVNDRKYNESPYERVLRNLRTNWEMPMNYLQERGYLKNVGSQTDNLNGDLSMNKFSFINGPSLNPFPYHDPNSILSTETDLSDKGSEKMSGNA